jgi:hypothetical protein
MCNIFLSEIQKIQFLEKLSKMQRTYYGFAKLAHIYRLKKSKVQINTDLCLNELNPRASNVFILYQNNSKYYFTALDLINMFNRNLSNCFDFSPDPILIKNPYNNINFSHAELYNSYFFIRWSGYVIPELLQGYFMSNFHMRTFRNNYEFNIINIHIKNFIYNSHHDVLYPIFQEMFTEFSDITKRLKIHESFPKDKLMNIMKPYMHLYYIWNYATNGTYKQCNAEYLLKKKLRLFVRFNPMFGRKYYKSNRILFNEIKFETLFNDTHINFYKDYCANELFKKPIPRRVYYESDNELNRENINQYNFTPNFVYFYEPNQELHGENLNENDVSRFIYYYRVDSTENLDETHENEVENVENEENEENVENGEAEFEEEIIDNGSIS